MDPIAAFRKQQERLGCPTSVVDTRFQELRDANPRWSTIFDRIDSNHSGTLQSDEVARGFKQILGAGAEVPQRQIKKVFSELDTEVVGALNFKQFHALANSVSKYMMDCPRWQQEEAKATAEEQEKRLQLEKESKAKEGPDIFAVLGLKKSSDLQEIEARKRRALSNANSNRQGRLARAGETVMRSSSTSGLASPAGSRPGSASNGKLPALAASRKMNVTAVTALAAKRFAGLKRSQISIESNVSAASAEPEEEEVPVSPTKKLRDAWERFSISSARGNSQRALARSRQVHLPDHLPQIRALGKRNAGCFALRFSDDGSQLAGGFFDGGVRIFDVDKGTQAHCMNLPRDQGGSAPEDACHEPTPPSPAASMDPDEDVDQSLRRLKALMSRWEPVTNLRWRPNCGRLNALAAVDTKGVLSLWDVPRLREARASRCLGRVETGSPLSALAFSCDGSACAVGGNQKVIKLFDIESEFGKSSFNEGITLGGGIAWCGKCTGHSLRITSICAHPANPKVFVSAGLDRHVLLWDVRAGTEPQNTIYGPEPAGDSMDISNDGTTLLIGSHRSKSPIEVYDLRLHEDARPAVAYSWRADEETSEGGGRYTTCQLLSAGWDGFENKTIVACGDNENLARVYERPHDPEEPLRIVGTLRGKAQAFWSSAISTDARNAAFGSADGAVCITNIERRG